VNNPTVDSRRNISPALKSSVLNPAYEARLRFLRLAARPIPMFGPDGVDADLAVRQNKVRAPRELKSAGRAVNSPW
jgi:hypothetical protein